MSTWVGKTKEKLNSPEVRRKVKPGHFEAGTHFDYLQIAARRQPPVLPIPKRATLGLETCESPSGRVEVELFIVMQNFDSPALSSFAWFSGKGLGNLASFLSASE